MSEIKFTASTRRRINGSDVRRVIRRTNERQQLFKPLVSSIVDSVLDDRLAPLTTQAQSQLTEYDELHLTSIQFYILRMT